MPKWTAELDAILLHAVFEECNISFSKPLCTKIAERVQQATGEECTYKAIENRLYSWKKKNTSGNTGLNSATNSPMPKAPKVPKTPKTPKIPKTPRFSNKKASAKKQLSDIEEDSDGPEGLDDDKEKHLLSPTPARRKRKAAELSYTESDFEDGDDEELYVPQSKVKTEHVEEENDPLPELSEEVV